MKFRLLTVAAVCAAEALAGDLMLAERGAKGAYTVVIPSAAAPAERFAAEELRDHVRAMTGVELPIVATDADLATPMVRLVSGTDESDGFSIRGDGGNLIIRGRCPRGTLYGVYELLERFGGCGWYAPWRTVVPKVERFSVPEKVSVAEEPMFAWRQPSWYGVRTNRLFAARCRMNAESPDGSVPNPDPKYGGYARRYVGELYSSHTYYVLVPPERHFRAHPEWFSLVNGHRLSERGQLCTSNPEVVEEAARRALELAAADPQAKVLGVSQMDWGGACECDGCRAILAEEGTPAGPALRFVNAIAERIERVRPDLTVETLVYSFTMDPPRHVRPRRNVMLCCCVKNDWRESFASPKIESNRRWKEKFEFWTSCCRDITVWDYTPCFYWACEPLPNERFFAEDMRYYRMRGASGIYMDGQPNPGTDFGDLKGWMLAKLAWNPNESWEGLRDRFLNGCYGTGAPFVRQILELQQRTVDAHPQLSLNTFLKDAPHVFDEAFADRSLELWNQAERAVADDADARFAVRMGKYPALVLKCMRIALRVRPYQVTRHPERFRLTAADRAVLDDERSVRSEAAARGIVLRHAHSRGRDRYIAHVIETLRQLPKAAADSWLAKADDFELRLGDFSGGVWNEKPGTIRIVEDPTALSRKAIVETVGRSSVMTATLRLMHLAHDDEPYRVRVRLKAARLSAAEGEVARIVVWDGRQKKSVRSRSVKMSELCDGWRWIDLGEVTLPDDGKIEVLPAAPGSTVVAETFSLDAIEFSRSGSGPSRP